MQQIGGISEWECRWAQRWGPLHRYAEKYEGAEFIQQSSVGVSRYIEQHHFLVHLLVVKSADCGELKRVRFLICFSFCNLQIKHTYVSLLYTKLKYEMVINNLRFKPKYLIYSNNKYLNRLYTYFCNIFILFSSVCWYFYDYYVHISTKIHSTSQPFYGSAKRGAVLQGWIVNCAESTSSNIPKL